MGRWMMLWGDRGCCGEMDDVVGRWVMWGDG